MGGHGHGRLGCRRRRPQWCRGHRFTCGSGGDGATPWHASLGTLALECTFPTALASAGVGVTSPMRAPLTLAQLSRTRARGDRATQVVQRCQGGSAELYAPDQGTSELSLGARALLGLLEGVQIRALGCLRNLLDLVAGPADLSGADGSWQPLWTSLCGLLTQVRGVAREGTRRMSCDAVALTPQKPTARVTLRRMAAAHRHRADSPAGGHHGDAVGARASRHRTRRARAAGPYDAHLQPRVPSSYLPRPPPARPPPRPGDDR